MNDNADSSPWKYPVTSFQNALEVATAVANAGGANVEVQNSVTASALGSSHTSGAFAQRLSSARTYGMISGGRGGNRLTDAGKRYFFPSSESEKRQAMFAFLNAPPVFAEIIKRFDGNKIPGSEMLANVLMREFKIPDSWKERVARFFLKTAQDVGVIDTQGFLRYSASRHSMDSGTPAVSRGFVETPMRPSAGSDSPIAGTSLAAVPSGMNTWVFSLEDQTVRVETTGELSPALWKKLNSYVQVLKPSKSDTSK